MNKWTLFLGVGIATAAIGVANANTNTNTGTNNQLNGPVYQGQYNQFSVGGYGGYVHETVDGSSSHFAFGGNVGYTFTKYIAAGLAFTHFPTHEVNKKDYSTNILTLGTKLIAPIYGDMLSLYGNFGIAYRMVDFAGAKSEKYSPYFGFGAEYPIVKNLNFDLQGNFYPTLQGVAGGEHLYMIGVGVNYVL